MRKITISLLIILIIIFISGCIGQTSKEKNLIDACIQKCNEVRSSQNISNGPCLLNQIEGTDWVCDVAHNPRLAIDNEQKNQCSAYGTIAKHFIEVDTNCQLIRSS